MSDDIVSTVNYKESNPIYQVIKKKFTQKLKDKYECEDYDSIVDYVFQLAFKSKIKKIECIQKLNKIFNNKAEFMMDYLWKITKDAENPQEENESVSDDTNSNIRKLKNKKNKRKRERSRSYSREKPKNKFDFDNFPNYPPMVPKGFYPPKGRFRRGVMPYGGTYLPYVMTPPPIIKR